MAIEAGLCARCTWADAVKSGRGSTFLRCGRNDAEPERFAKYPNLPRLICTGFEVMQQVEVVAEVEAEVER